MSDNGRQLDSKQRRNRAWALLIGSGIALFPIHNAWLTDHTAINGQATLFLPALASVLWILGSSFYVYNNWSGIKAKGWGDGRIVYFLLLIVVAIALSGANYSGWQDRVAPLGMGLALFALYLASRALGKDVFLPLTIGAVLTAIGVIVHAAVFRGQITGGYVFERNYDGVVGYVLLGTIFYTGRWRLQIVSLALVAMFLSGSPEALFNLSVAGAVLIARKDWGRGLLLTVAPLALVVAVWFGMGWGQQLYGYTVDIIRQVPSSPVGNLAQKPGVEPNVQPSPSYPDWRPTFIPEAGDIKDGDITYRHALGYRMYVIGYTLANLKPLGDGYIVTDFTWKTVHNVPLIIVEQLGYPGILAALAWLGVAVYCLRKTSWKYAWVLLLSMGVFDHFTWTQMGLFYWALAGVSTTSTAATDRLFTKGKGGTNGLSAVRG